MSFGWGIFVRRSEVETEKASASPYFLRSAKTLSIPSLSIVFIALALTRRRMNLPSEGTQNRFVCKLGRNFRLVLLLAWETLWPLIGFFPVTSQTLAITSLI